MTDVMKGLQHKARDHSRVPMPVSTLRTNSVDSELTTKRAHPPHSAYCGHFPAQWTADPHAGFSTGAPWMRVNDDYVDGWNVQAQLEDNTSVHAFYKLVLDYRKKSDLLVRPIAPHSHPIFEPER